MPRRAWIPPASALIVIVAAAAAVAQPGNDECASATIAAVGDNPFDSTLATDDGVDACGIDGSARDVWFRFTAPSAGAYRFTTDGTPRTVLNTVLTAYTACGGAVLACNDDNLGSFARFDLGLAAGQAVTLRVAGSPDYAPSVGTGVLGIRRLNTPANDACAGAATLVAGATPFDAGEATESGPQPTCTFTIPGIARPDLWYRYTPSVGGRVRLEANGDFGAGNMTLSVYTACGGQQILCDEDGGYLSDPRICGTVAVGQTYYIRLTTTLGGTGTILLLENVPVPTNDDCAGAIDVGLGSTPFDTTGACTNGADDVNQDLWYRYTNQTAARQGLALDIGGASFDATIATYRTCGAPFLDYRVDGGTRACLGPGESIVIAVGGNGRAFGQGSLNLTASALPANDTCDGAVDVFVGANTFDNRIGCPDPADDCSGPVGGGFYGSDVWYRFTAPRGGQCLIDTFGAAMDTYLAVYDGCGGTLVQCNDNAGVSQSLLCFSVEAGASYSIKFGYGGLSTDPNAQFGVGPLNISVRDFEAFDIPSNAVHEGEDCGVTPGVNDGCSRQPRVVGPIDRCVPIWGTLAIDFVAGDEDWYGFTVAAPEVVRLVGQGELPIGLSLRRVGDCEDPNPPVLLATNNFPFCGPGFESEDVTLPPGQYAVRVIPPFFAQIDCFQPNRYWLRLESASARPLISSQPASTVACAGGPSTFSIAVSSGGAFAYRWEVENPATGGWVAVIDGVNLGPGSGGGDFGASGASTDTLTLGPIHLSAGIVNFRCVVTGGCGAASSDAAALRICPADFSCAGGVSVQDIFAFLSAWFAQAPASDFNGDAAINVSDIFAFLSAWFAGCP